MQPELRLIRYFVAVAEEGNVTRAAERLHMAQPPLSAAIRQLEQQLGVALLDRTSRQVRLTAAGEQLLEQGRQLLAHADAVVGDVRAVERSPSGLLRAGLTPAARFGLAPELLDRWSTAVPGVMLEKKTCWDARSPSFTSVSFTGGPGAENVPRLQVACGRACRVDAQFQNCVGGAGEYQFGGGLNALPLDVGKIEIGLLPMERRTETE